MEDELIQKTSGTLTNLENMQHEDYKVIECSECEEEKAVEKGTWALDKGMCEECYCEYQGG